MKLMITSIAALIAGGALAQSMSQDPSQYIRASEITGNSLYTTNSYVENDWDLDAEVSDIDTAYTEIGSIEDIMLDAGGKVVGIVAEVGGFLDMGDKHVMMPLDDLRVVMSGDEAYFVTRFTEEQLEEREGVDQGWLDGS